MSLLAVCSKNKDHKTFSATAHVLEEWLVDEHGEWVSTLTCIEVTHKPDPDNTWTCAKCGAEAKVKVLIQ